MPRSKSVLKRQRQTETRQQRNQSARSELKTFEKKARKAIASGDAAADLKLAQKKLDKAASKGVIHPNKAARKKSRLTKAANKQASA
jgi:small subunit ribosomal protein S20